MIRKKTLTNTIIIHKHPLVQHTLNKQSSTFHNFREIIGSATFQPNVSKANVLHDPTLHICHRWLMGSLHVKKDSTGSITSKDIFPLWCMSRGLWCNAGIQFIRHCRSIRVYISPIHVEISLWAPLSQGSPFTLTWILDQLPAVFKPSPLTATPCYR